ncbi:MAG: hypothetical protein LBR55_01310, partial [Bacteroidales bacterium]|nr:hypothetical protein [Bacteroidales bacterium]
MASVWGVVQAQNAPVYSNNFATANSVNGLELRYANWVQQSNYTDVTPPPSALRLQNGYVVFPFAQDFFFENPTCKLHIEGVAGPCQSEGGLRISYSEDGTNYQIMEDIPFSFAYPWAGGYTTQTTIHILTRFIKIEHYGMDSGTSSCFDLLKVEIREFIHIPGCGDQNATNYNPLANIGDCSCTYASAPSVSISSVAIGSGLPTTEITCSNPHIDLNANVSSAECIKSEWLKDGTVIKSSFGSVGGVSAEAGTYTVNIYDYDDNLLATDQIVITGACGSNEPSVSIFPQTTFTCDGIDPVMLEAIAIGFPAGENVTYQWFRNGTPIGSWFEYNRGIATTEPGYYSVTATGETGSADAEINITDGCSETPDFYVTLDRTLYAAQGNSEDMLFGYFTIVANTPQAESMAWRIEVVPSDLGLNVSQLSGTGTSAGVAANRFIVPVNQTQEERQFKLNFIANDILSYSFKITQDGMTLVSGCTDPFSLTYNPNATVDDGSCEYKTIEDSIEGCTDPEALNYNPVATVSDNSCVYPSTEPQVIYGCTDPKSLNYNPNATENDNSCVYANEENTFNAVVEEEPVATVSTRPVENCALNINVAITEVSITEVDIISPTEVKVYWKIKLEGDITILYEANYPVSQSGVTLFYLSIICKDQLRSARAANPALRSGGENTGVTGFTVSAACDVDLGTTGILQTGTSSFTVYPNPTNGKLYIKTANDAAPALTLYTLQGAELLQTTGKEMDLSPYPQ